MNVGTETGQARQIRDGYRALKQRGSGEILRAREAARQLGISEGELLAAHTGDTAVRLVNNPQAVLEQVFICGEVMALSRNEECVHERKGVYTNASFFGHGGMKMGMFVNPDIDLRLFMNHWKYCFAACDNGRRSLQFFDKSGEAVHKIYLTAASDERGYKALVEECRHPDQEPAIKIEPCAPKKPDRPDRDIDWDGLRTTWENLKDTHDFHPMLKKFAVGREQALRGVGEDFAFQVDPASVRRTLELARDKHCEIMVFVGNRGCIQIHTGPVNRLLARGPWYNVLDSKFNLHLREDRIARAWVTRKPTKDGIVTALEVFNGDGEIIVTFFGKRKPGIAELPLWRAIVEEIAARPAADAA